MIARFAIAGLRIPSAFKLDQRERAIGLEGIELPFSRGERAFGRGGPRRNLDREVRVARQYMPRVFRLSINSKSDPPAGLRLFHQLRDRLIGFDLLASRLPNRPLPFAGFQADHRDKNRRIDPLIEFQKEQRIARDSLSGREAADQLRR